jgi:hypothetical protein
MQTEKSNIMCLLRCLSAVVRDIIVGYYEQQKDAALERDEDGSLREIIKNAPKFDDYNKFLKALKK